MQNGQYGPPLARVMPPVDEGSVWRRVPVFITQQHPWEETAPAFQCFPRNVTHSHVQVRIEVDCNEFISINTDTD